MRNVKRFIFIRNKNRKKIVKNSIMDFERNHNYEENQEKSEFEVKIEIEDLKESKTINIILM